MTHLISEDEREDARQQQKDEPYRMRWLRHQISDESGCPTRSASSPVEVRTDAVAASAAHPFGAPHTEAQPAPSANHATTPSSEAPRARYIHFFGSNT